jgi:capsular exopolysaccharide synthesis family protein
MVGQPPALSAGPDIMTILDGLRRRWIMVILLGGTLGSIAAVAVYFLLSPNATAYSKIAVAYTEPGFMNRPGAINDFKSVLSTTASAITSRVVINHALKAEAVRRLQLDKLNPDPAQMIEDGLRTEFKDNNEILTVYFTHPEPQVALAVSNALCDSYFEVIHRKQTEQRAAKITNLEKQYNDMVEANKQKKESLRDLGRVGDYSDPIQAMSDRAELKLRIRDSRRELTSAQLELEKARANLQAFEDNLKQLQGKKSTTGTTESEKPDIDLLIANAFDGDTEARSITERLKAKEKLVKDYDRRGMFGFESRRHREELDQLRGELADRKNEITARVKASVAAREKEEARRATVTPGMDRNLDPELTRNHLSRQVKNLERFVKDFEDQILKDSEMARKLVPPGPEYDRMANQIRSDEEIMNKLFNLLETEKLEAKAQPRVSRFSTQAELLKPDIKKQLAATAVTPLAILFAVGAVLAYVESAKRRVRGPAEISRGLGIRVVGAVPSQRDLSKQLVGPDGASDLEGTPVMESIDALRAALLHEHASRAIRTVLVTSAVAGEGKTTLAAALASSLARAGRKTLLLDGDLRRPSVHQMFELAPQPGFSEVLLEEVPLADAIVETPLENLWVLPAGQWDREVLLALSRDGVGDIFERIGEEFDFVLIDSHPVLEAADALHIGRQSDVVLLSVLNGVSQMPRVYAASQQMTSLGIRVLGAVVNAANPEDALTTPSPVAVSMPH